MNKELDGKVGIITGAARGIGAAAARALCARGAHVVLTDTLEHEGKAEVESLTGHGYSAEFFALDVRNVFEWKALIDKLSASSGRIDFLVNNAGIVVSRNIENATSEEFELLLHVNLMGTFNGMQAVIPLMKSSGGGSIVNMASTASAKSSAATTIYGATKAAIASLTKSAAIHLAETGSGIRVNSIHPGPVDTEFMRQGMRGLDPSIEQMVINSVPLKRVGTPEDVGNAVLYLVGDGSAYITGTELFVDGGLSAV